MILVEGCDGSGKTTLVNRLAEDLSLQIGPRSTASRDDLYKVTRIDTYTALGMAVEGGRPPYIWDRLGPLSDPIYSQVQGRTQAFHPREIEYFAGIVQALRCPVIVCRTDRKTTEDNAKRSHQMEDVLPNVPFIWNAYNRLIVVTPWMTPYNYQADKYEEVKEEVETYVKRRKVREWQS